jgi:hypothetical protein
MGVPSRFETSALAPPGAAGLRCLDFLLYHVSHVSIVYQLTNCVSVGALNCVSVELCISWKWVDTCWGAVIGTQEQKSRLAAVVIFCFYALPENCDSIIDRIIDI